MFQVRLLSLPRITRETVGCPTSNCWCRLPLLLHSSLSTARLKKQRSREHVHYITPVMGDKYKLLRAMNLLYQRIPGGRLVVQTPISGAGCRSKYVLSFYWPDQSKKRIREHVNQMVSVMGAKYKTFHTMHLPIPRIPWVGDSWQPVAQIPVVGVSGPFYSVPAF